MVHYYDPVRRRTIAWPNMGDITNDQIVDMYHRRPSGANHSHLTIDFLHQVSCTFAQDQAAGGRKLNQPVY
jgi:hypothetical protein